jgi:hypothetical protein
MKATIVDRQRVETDANDNTIKPYISYTIHIAQDNIEWIIQKRYSQFYKLHTSITTAYPNVTLSSTFPPKKFVGNMKQSHISQREKALQSWLSCILEEDKMLERSRDLHEFLETKQHLGALHQTWLLDVNI